MDDALAGRTYAIPFERVWSAVTSLAESSRGWSVRVADDQTGIVEAEASALLGKGSSSVWIEVGLDANAQTRVDMASASTSGRGRPGPHRRRIRRFFRRLDATLGAGPDTILDDSRAET